MKQDTHLLGDLKMGVPWRTMKQDTHLLGDSSAI